MPKFTNNSLVDNCVNIPTNPCTNRGFHVLDDANAIEDIVRGVIFDPSAKRQREQWIAGKVSGCLSRSPPRFKRLPVAPDGSQ